MSTRSTPYALWSECEKPLREADWPTLSRRVVALATLAANAHNTQPWKFRILKERVEIHPDWSRQLLASDPTGRQLWLSLGASLENLLVALASRGLIGSAALDSSEGERHLFIHVNIRDAAAASDTNAQRLVTAIPLRRTCRHVFKANPIPHDVILSERSESKDLVHIASVTDATAIRSTADLAAAATRDAFSQTPFRRELSHWVRNNFTKQSDGMPGFANGVPNLPSFLGSTLIRFVNIGKKQAADEHAWITSSPLLTVLSTAKDDPESWIAAGQLLKRFALIGTAKGLAYSIIESPIEIATYRPKLTALITNYQLPITSPLPQVLMRFGHCDKPHRPTPRRPLEHVITLSSTNFLDKHTFRISSIPKKQNCST